MMIFKLLLCSVKGDVMIGTVTVPDAAGISIREQGSVQFTDSTTYWRRLPPDTQVKVGSLVGMYGTERAVTLHGITLEEFELIPGYYFMPSAAYVRLVHEGKL
jgi:hypothetical protein